ncbi:hypothetical protein K280104A7_05660 [Candidatus Bariatricus faecipullorum]
MAKQQFQEKLAGILAQSRRNGNVISKEETEKFFEDEGLSKEQMELVFDYLLSQKVLVKGYVKTGGSIHVTGSAETEGKFSEEEQDFLRHYEKELQEMPSGTPVAYYLPRVLALAKKLHDGRVFLGDLVQEGSVGLMMALEKENSSEEEILRTVRELMQMYLENQGEMKTRDQRLADQVNELDVQIKRLTEEMGRKITVEELAEFTGRTEEEVTDILKLAGEEVKEEE